MDLDAMPDALCLWVSFTGELGYDIYGPAQHQRALYSAILRAGEDLKLAPAGTRALSSLRIEKGFAAWGLDLSPDYTVMEPGLDWAVDWTRNTYRC